MTEQGVPSDVLVGDHMQVTADLVRLVGSANAALVWTRIEYRARHFAHAHEHDGRAWWEVTARELGQETGLSPDAAERAAKKCVEGGFLLAEQHSLPMQTMSYSPVIVQSAISRNGADPIREIADSNGRNRGLQSAESRIAPLAEEAEEVEEAHDDDAAQRRERRVSLFESVWGRWPRKDSKKRAVEKFLKLPADQVLEVARAIAAHGDAHAKHTPPEFVPHLVTWLNQERWSDPLPQPRTGRGRQQSDLALIASYVEGGADRAALEG